MRRLVEAYRSATVPPAGVEKASRWERTKRSFVMVATTVISAVLSLVVVSIPVRIVGWEPQGVIGGLGLAVVWFAVWGYIDIRFFRYAIVRFDLVPPWQFRAPTEGGAARMSARVLEIKDEFVNKEAVPVDEAESFVHIGHDHDYHPTAGFWFPSGSTWSGEYTGWVHRKHEIPKGELIQYPCDDREPEILGRDDLPPWVRNRKTPDFLEVADRCSEEGSP